MGGHGTHVQILGSVCVTVGDRRTAPPSASQRRLIAVLALHAGESLRTAYLSDLLSVTPAALRTTVSRVRHHIGPAISTDPCSYSLDAEVDADLFVAALGSAGHLTDLEAKLERFDEALSWWHGPALDEFRTESWAQAGAARLEELRSVAVEQRAVTLLELGRHGEAIAALDVEVEAHPFHERPHRLLMEALAADGRQTEALRVYQRHRQHLAEHVGMEPSTEIQRLEVAIATAEGPLSRGAAAAPGRPTRR